MRNRLLTLCALATPLLLAGCGGSTDAAAGTVGTTTATAMSTATATSTTTAAQTTTTDAAAPSSRSTAACTSPASGSRGGVPDGAHARQTLDVDGDGKPDTVYIDDETDVGGGVVFGIATAAGGGFSDDFSSASGSSNRTVLVADVTGHGDLVAFADDGRQVQLFAISDCSFVPVQNAQGQQYTFDRGFTGFGTGVGCADVDGDGSRDLVGLAADGSTITSTIVRLDGPNASNGASSTLSDASKAQLDEARQVTCGDLTEADDGVGIGA